MKKKLSLCILFLALISFSLAAQEKNKIIVCDNGLEMFGWDLNFIRHAKTSIEVLACFFGGTTACELLEAIESRLGEVPDLQVHILASPVFMKAKEYQLIDQLQRCYPDNFHIEYHTQVLKLFPEMTSIDNHVKMFVVDETYFSAGGTNLEEKHCSEGTFTPDRDTDQDHAILPAGMRDQDVVGRGPLAHELRVAFFKLFSLWEHYNQRQIIESNPEAFCGHHYFEVKEKCCIESFEHSDRLRVLEPHQVKCVFGGPHQQHNAITHEYIKLINEAEKEIIIANLYFYPVQPLLQALMDAVNRGVKLTIITNGINDRSPESAKFFGWACRMSYVPIFYGTPFSQYESHSVHNLPVRNTHIYEYYIQDMLLHKKMMLVDQKIFVVGSYNLGIKSSIGDYELILVFNSEEVASDVNKVIEKDLLFSKKISPLEAVEWYFDPFLSYYGELQKTFGGFM